jgi:hypothetical protein
MSEQKQPHKEKVKTEAPTTPTTPTTPTKPTTPSTTPTPKPTPTITPEIVQRFFNSNRGGRRSEIERVIREVADGPIANPNTGEGLRFLDHNVGAVYRVVKKLSLTDKIRVRPVKKGASKPCVIGRIK